MDTQDVTTSAPPVNENKSWMDYIRENKTMVIIIIILIVIAIWYFAFRKPSATVTTGNVDSSALPPVGTVKVTKV